MLGEKARFDLLCCGGKEDMWSGDNAFCLFPVTISGDQIPPRSSQLVASISAPMGVFS